MTDRSDNVIPLRPRGAPCPICSRPAHADYRPFCSKRCADVDLHRWLGEGYRIEGNDLSDDEPRDDDEPA